MEVPIHKKRTASMANDNIYQTYNIIESPEINDIVNNVFQKSFNINGNEKYVLPKSEYLFIANPWEIDELQLIKKDLNEIKSKLNSYCCNDWHHHTTQHNKAKDIQWRICRDFNPEFVTKAWCKFHEIISRYPLVPKEYIFNNKNKFLSLHLCEAPGAFVTCLNHWLKINEPCVQWDWLAMTYNPYYEGNSNSNMISDDRFIIHTLDNWFFGNDYTGNLMVLENLEELIKRTKEKGNISLITADGSVNCTNNPGEQEGTVVNLHFSEVVAAMHILQAGGNFLLKIFTIFEHQSVCLIYFLCCTFKEVHFYKPVTSKGGNSEVYLICLGFKGFELISSYLPLFRNVYGKNSTTAMFRKCDIPENFIKQVISCAEIFKNLQCQVIADNITTYNIENKFAINLKMKKIAKLVADKFFNEFPLQKLHIDLQIVGNWRLKRINNYNWTSECSADSFNQIQKNQILNPAHRLLLHANILKSVELPSKIFSFKAVNHYADICIRIGKSYKQIKNSRFCMYRISIIFDLLFQAIESEKYIQLSLINQPNLAKYESKMKEVWITRYKIINFQFCEICNNHETITVIQNILANLQDGDSIILLGFFLLTQFNVGLIYLLAHTFDSVDFNIDKEIGCSVTLKYFKNKLSIIEKINQIHETSEITTVTNKIVLSIVSIKQLYGSELYGIIMQLNSYIAKYYIDFIASICDKNIQDNK